MNENIIIVMTHECPVCHWQTNNGGFTSTILGAEGDWCLKCYVKETTKNVPLLVQITAPLAKEKQ